MICAELDAHAAAEEETFYPVVRAELPYGETLATEGEERTRRSSPAHRSHPEKTDPEHVASCERTRAGRQHHVEEEESEMLPVARTTLGEDRWSKSETQFEAAKARSQG